MKIDQVHPRCDMVLVRRVPDEEALPSGLFVPQMARDRQTGIRIGEVLRVGAGDKREYDEYEKLYDCSFEGGQPGRFPMECRPGDRILYYRCPDNDVVVDGVPCVLLREEQHVLAILGDA